MVAGVILLHLASLSCVLALPLVGIELQDVNTSAIRDKREPSRSMTFSGFMPGRGLSAFATSGDFAPGLGRRPWGQGEPAGQEHPPERGQSPWQEDKKVEEEEEEEEAPAPRPTKKNKKKYSPKDTREEDEEEFERPSRGGGNAAASFNAWFPIMLGMFPSSGFPGEDGVYSRGYPQGPSQGPSYGGHQGPSQGPSYGGHGGPSYGGHQGPRYPQGGTHTTVIANSVSNGRSGVASSHAIAYGGGESPSYRSGQSYGGGSPSHR